MSISTGENYFVKTVFSFNFYFSQCEAKTENVCIDVTETKCEVSFLNLALLDILHLCLGCAL